MLYNNVQDKGGRYLFLFYRNKNIGLQKAVIV